MDKLTEKRLQLKQEIADLTAELRAAKTTIKVLQSDLKDERNDSIQDKQLIKSILEENTNLRHVIKIVVQLAPIPKRVAMLLNIYLDYFDQI